MKRLLCILTLLCGLPLLAADSTIGNLGHITTVPDTYKMPWESTPPVLDFYTTFSELTNQILNGVASQGYATAAAQASTNPIPQMIGSVVGTSNFITSAQAGVQIGLSNANYLLLTGGTVSGAVLSTSSTTNAPSNPELATAGWVRGLFSGGQIAYATANVDPIATNPGTAGQPVYTFASTIPPSSSRTYTAPNAGDYFGSVITTNTFTSLQGPIDVNAYVAAIGGVGGPAVAIHPELYYSYDKTNWYGDYDSGDQSLTIGVTNLKQFVITFPTITATNASGFYIERRFKVGTASGATHPDVVFMIGTNSVSGTNNASHLSISGVGGSSGLMSASQIITALGTNAVTNALNAATATTATNDSLSRNISTSYGLLVGTNTFTGTNVFTGPVLMSGTTSNRGVAYFGTGNSYFDTAGKLNVGNDSYYGNIYVTGLIKLTASGNIGYLYPDSSNNGIMIKDGSAAMNSRLTVSNIFLLGTLTATNGIIFRQLALIPTNSIPASDVANLITNFLWLNLTNTIGGGGLTGVYSNNVNGTLHLVRPTMTDTAWP
jgi:hypothetical protein